MISAQASQPRPRYFWAELLQRVFPGGCAHLRSLRWTKQAPRRHHRTDSDLRHPRPPRTRRARRRAALRGSDADHAPRLGRMNPPWTLRSCASSRASGPQDRAPTPRPGGGRRRRVRVARRRAGGPMFAALADFGAPLAGVDVGDLLDPEIVFQVGVPPNRIDVLTDLAGVEFEDAWRTRVSTHYADIPWRSSGWTSCRTRSCGPCPSISSRSRRAVGRHWRVGGDRRLGPGRARHQRRQRCERRARRPPHAVRERGLEPRWQVFKLRLPAKTVAWRPDGSALAIAGGGWLRVLEARDE